MNTITLNNNRGIASVTVVDDNGTLTSYLGQASEAWLDAEVVRLQAKYPAFVVTVVNV